MTDFAPLGFSVDTAGLKTAAAEAEKTSVDLLKVADAADKVALSAKAKAEALKQAADREKAATASATEEQKKNAAALELAATKAKALAEAKVAEAAALRKGAEAAAANAKALADQVAASEKGTRAFSAFGAAVGKFGSGLGGATQSVLALTTGLAQGGPLGLATAATTVTQNLGRLLATAGPVGAAVGGIAAGVTAAGAAFVAGQVHLAKYSDQLALLEARMKNTLGTVRGPQMIGQLRTLSQGTGFGFDNSVNSFLRQARNREDIGATSEQILTLTELTQKLGAVSGAGGGEIASGMLQLSQALAAGRLNGDELRSIMENMPALAKAIADGLGVSVGQLRNMGAEGQLTSDKVFAALLSQTQKIRAEFEALPETLAQASQKLGDNWDRLLAELGRRTKASDFAKGLTSAANNVVGGAADLLTPATLDQQIRKARDRVSAADALNARSWFRPGDAAAQLQVAQRELESLYRKQERQSAGAASSERREMDGVSNATISRATKLADETLKLASAQKEAKTSTETLEKGIAELERQLALGTAAEGAAKKLDTLRQALLVVRQEALKSVDAFALYQQETQRLSAMRGKFGTDASIGLDAYKLQQDAANQGRVVSDSDATAAVVARRLEEARQKAEKEVEELQRLRDAVDHGVRSRQDIAGYTAAEAKRAELGATVAATPEGATLIEAARRRAEEQFRLQRRQSDQQSELDPDTRSTGDVRRNLEQLQRSIADLAAIRGADAAARSARQFESGLAEELKTIPEAMRSEYAKLSRLQREMQLGNAREDFLKGYEDSLKYAREEYNLSGLIGVERENALTLLQAEITAKRQGITLGATDLDRLRQSIAAQGELNQKVKEQNEAVQRLDGFRSTTNSAFKSLIKGDAKGAGKQFIDYFADLGVSNLTNGLLGKSGEAGGGLFGNLFGGLFGTGAGGQRGSSAANPLFVTMGGIGSLGGLGGLLGGGSAGGVAGGTPSITDATKLLTSIAGGNVGASGIAGLNPLFQKNLGSMVKDAQGLFGPNAITINSAFRSVDRQSELWQAALTKYGSADAARKWVAPPGSSQHNFGGAADLGYASPQVMQWAQANAGNYGLNYRLPNENWHIELDKSAQTAATNLDALATSGTSATSAIGDLSSGLTDTAKVLTEGTKSLSGATAGLSNAAGSVTGTGTAGAGVGATSGLAGLFTGLSNLTQGLFSVIGSIGTSLFSGIGSLFGGLFHEGGIVGAGGSPIYASAALWAGAPRHHAGVNLASDERPAILQTGERVVSRMDNARLVGAVEAMSARGEAAQNVQQTTVVQQTIMQDFRGVDPSMRAFVAAQTQAAKSQAVQEAVTAVGERSRKAPGYLGR